MSTKATVTDLPNRHDEHMIGKLSELEEQFEAAKDELKRAELNFQKVRKELSAAKCQKLLLDFELRGITPGTKITDGNGIWGFCGVEPQEIFTDRAGASIILHAVKNDGTIGKKRVRPFGVYVRDLKPCDP